MKAIDYLRSKEWTMGGGKQCPECCGSPISAHGHPCHATADTIGHKPDCPLALAIRDLGGDVVFLGDYKSDVVYEAYWDEDGLLSMGIKSEEGSACPICQSENHREIRSGRFRYKDSWQVNKCECGHEWTVDI